MLLLFVNRRHVAALFSQLLLLATLLLADGWVLVLVSREIGLYAALAAQGAVALAAAIVLGNSIHHRIRIIRSEARRGIFRPFRYARLAAVITAGVLLVLPGFVSDFLGLLLYYPPGRFIFSAIFLRCHREVLPAVHEYVTLAAFSSDGSKPAGGPPEAAAPEAAGEPPGDPPERFRDGAPPCDPPPGTPQ
ncbi:Protein affecting phage T7 exclusion by the F plasmid, UPF0716 family [Alkalispirochaeta americana]|uniref:Protein affecting phage T7 exclusion by the F plasmid, UPF0716 family n=1 Tax=Alkalispirochaeta americana TaxID=159291 RepID=A0A1N6RZZ1_9SPIO|nr:Protein affecting phage T7 exclusion by the F plasmid, UPF0716 family [Alkalispirochaeta americana]